MCQDGGRLSGFRLAVGGGGRTDCGRGFLAIRVGLGGRSERLDVADELPALRFGKFRPHGHAVAYNPVGEQPEKRSGGRLLHFVGEQAWGFLAALGHFSVTLYAMQIEQFGTCRHGVGICFQGIRPSDRFLGSFSQFRVDRVVFSGQCGVLGLCRGYAEG